MIPSNEKLAHLAIEEWKNVVGYEGYYIVSSFGNVKSLDRKCNARAKKHAIRKGKNIKKLSSDLWPYYSVNLCVNDKRNKMFIHRLVCEAFIGIDKSKEINHIDVNKLNNNIVNLEYCTKSENCKHSLYVLGNLSGHRRYVKNENNGKIYKSVTDAANENGFKRQTMQYRLNNNLKINNMEFKYVYPI